MIRLAALSLLLPAAVLAGPKVEIVGHRGASHDAPENTIASFKEAWKQGADGAELDVHLTKDGKLVVIHDADVKRTTGSAGKVSAMTFDEVRKLDAGRWKAEAFAGEKVPLLTEMLATVPAGKKVYVEVKCGPEAVPELVRVLKASGLKPELSPVISFNAAVVAAVKKARPDAPAYWIVSLNGKKPPTAEELIRRAKELGADGLDLSATKVLDAAFAKKVKAAGLRLDVWTVNDAAVARRMLEFGVDGITTDRPGWLRERLAK
jgi:glycerophosphoryl diester phosphodiesterase